jgi:hypothetical protein
MTLRDVVNSILDFNLFNLLWVAAIPIGLMLITLPLIGIGAGLEAWEKLKKPRWVTVLGEWTIAAVVIVIGGFLFESCR